MEVAILIKITKEKNLGKKSRKFVQISMHFQVQLLQDMVLIRDELFSRERDGWMVGFILEC